MSIRCKNHRCRHCYIDLEEPGSPTVCTADDAQLIRIPEARVFVLKCNTYLKRDPGQHLRPICPIHNDGLFDGQLPPPYQTAPAELVKEVPQVVFTAEPPTAADGPFEDYDTAGKKSYVMPVKTIEEECDT